MLLAVILESHTVLCIVFAAEVNRYYEQVDKLTWKARDFVLQSVEVH